MPLLRVHGTFLKVDEKATIRNRYNRIPHPALDTKWERNTYNLDGIKYEQQKQKAKRIALSQAILNKIDKKS